MGWWRAACLLARADWTLLARDGRFAAAVAGALFIPALYALIYLSSMWDPSTRTGALRAGLVNEDTGVVFRGQATHMGEDVSQTLLRQGLFQWQRFDDAESARRAVRRGELSFAVLIPPDFSAQAVPGREAGAAKLVIYTSEGNSYSGAGFAKRFAPELAHRVNEALNEQRWDLVLTTAPTRHGRVRPSWPWDWARRARPRSRCSVEPPSWPMPAPSSPAAGDSSPRDCVHWTATARRTRTSTR